MSNQLTLSGANAFLGISGKELKDLLDATSKATNQTEEECMRGVKAIVISLSMVKIQSAIGQHLVTQ
jgi:hypothetical protein